MRPWRHLQTEGWTRLRFPSNVAPCRPTVVAGTSVRCDDWPAPDSPERHRSARQRCADRSAARRSSPATRLPLTRTADDPARSPIETRASSIPDT